jgi:antibiotic biosynthesis monooxygenase (ABM) superfamily enzyme
MPDNGRPGGVTVVVRRTIQPDATAAFEEWLRGIIRVSSGFEGHGGVEVIRPAPDQGQDWVIVFRFDSQEQLAAWDASPERAAWLAQVEPLTVSSSVEVVSGLEYWFTLPGDAGTQPPPRWKMAVVTTLGLYPLVLWVGPWLSQFGDALPHPLTVLITLMILVAFMTWGVMPILIRLLRPWLFGRR